METTIAATADAQDERTRLAHYLDGFAEEPGYLDYARFGPLSREVAAESAVQRHALSRASHGTAERLRSATDRMRAALAPVIGFRDDQIVFQAGAAEGAAQALFGLAGGVLVARDESRAVTVAAVRASETQHAAAPIWLETDHGRVTPGQVREQLTTTTTAVAVSAVDARTGYQADLEGLRDVIGDRLLVVDASAAVGAVDLDLTVADVVVCGGERWLRAGFGTGFLALSDRAVARLTPVLSGPGALDAPDDEWTAGEPLALPVAGAQAFQLGLPAPDAASRLAQAALELGAVGQATVAARIADLVDEVIDVADEQAMPVVSPRQRPERAAIVVLEPAPDRLAPLIAALFNAGVTVSVHGGRVRCSVHAGTTAETVALLREALVAHAQAAPAVR